MPVTRDRAVIGRATRDRALLIVLAIALAARVGVVVATPDFRPIFDASHYDRLGASIADGGSYFGQGTPAVPSAFRPPLYPLALAAVHVVGGGWTIERLLGALLGVAAILLVFLVARRLWGRRVAIVAGAIAAVFPPLVVLNASLLSESLFLPMVLGALLCVLQYRRDRRPRWLIAAGVVCGLGALTRTNGLVLVLPAAAGVWLTPRWTRATLTAPVILVLATAVAVSPWVIRNAVVFDRFVGISTQTGVALGATYNADAAKLAPAGRPVQTFEAPSLRDIYVHPSRDEAELSSRLTHRAVDFARDHPGYVVRTLGWNTLRVFDLHRDEPFKTVFQAGYLQALGVGSLASPVVLVAIYLVLLLALAGAVVEARPGRRRAPLFVWGFPLLLVIPAIAIYGLSRYRAPVDPFLIMLAAVALAGRGPRGGLRSRGHLPDRSASQQTTRPGSRPAAPRTSRAG